MLPYDLESILFGDIYFTLNHEIQLQRSIYHIFYHINFIVS